MTAGFAPAPEKKLSSLPMAMPKSYSLAWADEFNTPVPDGRKWAFDTQYNKQGWHNQELQYYSDARSENARIEAGKLVLEARAERLRKADFGDWGGQDFTSARLVTRGHAQWTYGYFEVRAKLPCAVGTWPAIWLLPVDDGGNWEEGGEIDIMEHVGHEPGLVHHSLHTAKLNFRRGTHQSAATKVPSACDEFHTYQLHWTPDRLLFGVDGIVNFTHERRSGDRKDWPFDRPFYLILNVAVGGSWGGAKGVDPSALPARMEVDYVRVYRDKTG